MDIHDKLVYKLLACNRVRIGDFDIAASRCSARVKSRR